MFAYGDMFILSLLLGTLARAFMLRVDYRQFPSFPHSYVIHLMIGIIASTLGALFLPALIEKEYIAVTFLTVGAQQFREVRNLERESMEKIEESEIIPKGSAYIEGIAKLFEARNYMALVTAVVTSILYYYLGWVVAVLGGGITAYLLHLFVTGPHVSDMARIQIVPLNIQGNNIGIDDVIMMNIGEEEALEKWRKEGVGIKVIPRDENARASLANLGQRQAILHDLSILMGVKLDKGIQQFTPLARLQIDEGTLNIIIIPQEPDSKYIEKAVEKIPIIESTQRKPLKSFAGRRAAD